MKIKKVNGTYDTYSVELSFMQLNELKNSLAVDHANPVSDELFQNLVWYMQNIEGPGESAEDLKKAEEAEASGMGGPGAEGEPLDPEAAADEFLPQAPDDEGGVDEAPGGPGGEGGDEALGGTDEEGTGGPLGGPPAGQSSGGRAGAEADRRVPRPEAFQSAPAKHRR